VLRPAAGEARDTVGKVTVALFGLLALLGLALVGFGSFQRARNSIVAGGALLISVAGAWMVGLPGAALGLIVLAFLRRRSGANATGRVD
jgi:hypothetical protein